MEVLGYVMAGPLANQVLIARWFRARRGRAMGYAYLGLGFGGVVSPLLVNFLIGSVGWRHAIEIVGVLTLIVLLPLGIFITRSVPAELGLLPDGEERSGMPKDGSDTEISVSAGIAAAIRTANFWLILLGSTLVVGAIGAVIQHFILYLKDQGYSATTASRFLIALLAASLVGRVLVGYLADRFRKKYDGAFLFVAGSLYPIPCRGSPSRRCWSFVLIFGFSIPLVTAECFGTASLGKLLALIIMGYSIGQWGAPWIAGRIFDARHSYELAWKIMAAAGLLGAAAIYAVSTSPNKTP